MPLLMRHFLKNERGTIIALWSLLLPIMAGVGGLALDGGNWYMNARDLQSASDAAVLTAAYRAGQGQNVNIAAIVQNEMTRNGYTGNVTVVVHSPPTEGSYTHDNTAVEALVSIPSNSFLASAVGVHGSTITARSVARRDATPDDACILALNASASKAVDVSGSAVLTSGKCVMASNSSSTSSISVGGNSDLTLNSIYSTGDVNYYGSYTIDLTVPAKTYRTPLKDPYANVPVPTPSNTCASDKLNKTGTTTFSPGTFCSGLKLVAGESVSLNPGTYIMQGNFDIGASASITGTGVTIILEKGSNGKYGSVKINGGSTVDLKAQTSGTYKGIVMMQDRNATGASNTFNGGANMSLQGGLYFPSSYVQFNGNNGQNANCVQLVADTISFSGNSSFNDNCESLGTKSIPLPGSVVLAE